MNKEQQIANKVSDIINTEVLFDINCVDTRKRFNKAVVEYFDDLLNGTIFDYYVICNESNNDNGSNVFKSEIFIKYNEYEDFKKCNFNVIL